MRRLWHGPSRAVLRPGSQGSRRCAEDSNVTYESFKINWGAWRARWGAFCAAGLQTFLAARPLRQIANRSPAPLGNPRTARAIGRSAQCRSETPDNTDHKSRGILGSPLLKEVFILGCLGTRAITETA